MIKTKRIKSISGYKIYNSHVESTNEFRILFEDGLTGIGASPQGETISIYEDQAEPIDPKMVIEKIAQQGLFGKDISQEAFDLNLMQNVSSFGRNNVYALSLAFYNGLSACKESDGGSINTAEISFPRICFNILNGGWHAYTNPVLSDFPEFLLVSKNNELDKIITQHNQIQQVVRERLLRHSKTVIGGNPVNIFATRDNRECLDFLLNVCHQTGTSDQFDLMIDASGTDLWDGSGYHLPATSQENYSPEGFLAYWEDIIRQYGLGFLEDPFYEKDINNWQRLTISQQECNIIGDNFYSSDAGRIKNGAENNYSHGVIIKPNQAGTITAVRKAIESAKRSGQIIITSHRSISTESTYLSELTIEENAPIIKIGPLLTDYSSVIRLNAMIRLLQRGKNESGDHHLHDAARAHNV
jgi:enolase